MAKTTAERCRPEEYDYDVRAEVTSEEAERPAFRRPPSRGIAATPFARLADCRLRDIFLFAFRREWEA